MRWCLIICLVLCVAVAAQADVVSAVQGLITRVLGAKYLSSFILQVIPADPQTGRDVFEIDSSGNSVILRGNYGVSLAAGLGWYLKYSCNASWSWGRDGTGNQFGSVPAPGALPLLPAKQRIVSPVKWRYYYNVCTAGYSTPWWNMQQWQEEIDRMALWGVNLPLAFAGQEMAWYKLYTSLGLTADDLAPYFAGPAFLPWERMGNMRGWGGPLDVEWMQSQADLQRSILSAVRAYGMTAVLPGFAGHVPNSITKIYPNANYTKNANWGNFNSTFTGDLLLEPTDPVFVSLGAQFYKYLIEEFGTDHIYNCDMYNEMNPSSTDLTFLQAANTAVYQAMQQADPQAIYLMQGWLFYSGRAFWTPPRVQAYLSGVPDQQMIILDLFTEQTPVWSQYDSFYGKPWVWNMLLVFGGRRGLYGDLERIASGPITVQAMSKNMVGIGATPEAIDILPVMFDLLFEQGWRTQIVEIDDWLQQYATRRYGGDSVLINNAWQMLKTAAYSHPIDTAVLERTPQIQAGGTENTNATEILNSLRLFVQAAHEGQIDSKVGPFQYDLTDLTRQVLVNLFQDIQVMQGNEYRRWQLSSVNSTDSVIALSNAMMETIELLDQVLGANVNYLLGNWIADARQWARTEDEADNREFNARNQITLWGPDGEINDYAAKHWNGLVGDYYHARWAYHTGQLIDSVRLGYQIDWTQYSAELLLIEQDWSAQTGYYPIAASGTDPVDLAADVLAVYDSIDPSRYKMVPNTDIACGMTPCDIMQAWHRNIGVLQYLCSLDPECQGFNTNGYMKSTQTGQVPAPGSNVYLKLW